MRSLLALLFLVALADRVTLQAAPVTLQPGEKLSFRVSWGPWTAGAIEVLAEAKTGESGQPRTEVVVHTSSTGIIRTLYSFDGEVRALFDPTDGKLLSATATTRSRKHSTNASITLDHAASRATYVDHCDAARNSTVPLPDSRPVDFVTGLIETRAWSLRPGDQRQMSVLFDNQFYNLTLSAVGYETIRTNDGRREALLVTPRMDGEARGFFKDGGSIRVWLEREAPHLPVRFEVRTRSGTAVALLTDYQAPQPSVPPQKI